MTVHAIGWHPFGQVVHIPDGADVGAAILWLWLRWKLALGLKRDDEGRSLAELTLHAD